MTLHWWKPSSKCPSHPGRNRAGPQLKSRGGWPAPLTPPCLCITLLLLYLHKTQSKPHMDFSKCGRRNPTQPHTRIDAHKIGTLHVEPKPKIAVQILNSTLNSDDTDKRDPSAGRATRFKSSATLSTQSECRLQREKPQNAPAALYQKSIRESKANECELPDS